MKRNQSIVAASLGSVALVAVFTLSGGGAAYASPPSPDGTAAPLQSCWIDASTQQSLCVPTGEDLIAAVQEEDGITIDVPAGTNVSDVKITDAHILAATTFSVTASVSVEPVSIIYDDINYGGGSFIMSSGAGCTAGLPSLVPYGWNDRASSTSISASDASHG